MLCHSSGSDDKGKSIARQHYIGLGVNVGVGKTKYERLHEVQREIHKYLKPLFDAAAEKDKSSIKRPTVARGVPATPSAPVAESAPSLARTAGSVEQAA